MTTPEITDERDRDRDPSGQRVGSALAATALVERQARELAPRVVGRLGDDPTHSENELHGAELIPSKSDAEGRILSEARARVGGRRCPARLATAPANVYLVHQVDAESKRGALQEVHRNVPTFCHPTRRRRRPSRSSRSRSPAAPRSPRPRRTAAKSSEPVTLRLGYFPNVTHAAPIVGVQGGIFAKKLGSGVEAGAQDLQLRHRGRRRSWPTRSTPPTSGRTRRSPRDPVRQGRQGHLRRRIGRRVPRRQARHHRAPPTSRARRSRRRSSATRRTSRLRSWLKKKGLEHRHHRWRRRHDQAAGQRHVARRVQDAATSTAPGCPSRGRPASSRGRRQDPRRRGRPVARGQVRHHAARSSPRSSSRTHPDVVQKLVDRAGRGERLHQEQRGRGRGARVAGHREGDRQADLR